MPDPPVPFNRPSIVGDELHHIREAVERGYLSGDGHFTRRCHALLEAELGVPKVLLTSSCTHALEMAALLLDVGPGDEVVVPSFTFASTVNAFVLRGARPVFVDIRPDTLNLDVSQVADAITPRTKAIVPVHYAGVGCEMDRLMEIADARGVPVVEDNAHGLLGTYRGRSLGTFGALAVQSFHETKNFSCGEGGALVINDPRYIDRAEIVREKGTDRSRYVRGQIDRYSWVDLGSSFLPSELQAAFLYGQLQARDRIQSARRRIWERYFAELGGWAEEVGALLPYVPPDAGQSYHIFYLLLPSPELRDALIAHLERVGVTAASHYVPLHRSVAGKRYGVRPVALPVTEAVSDRLLRLPLYADLSEEDQARVVAGVRSFRGV